MRWAVILVKIPDNWIEHAVETYGAHIRVFNCMPYDTNGGRGFLEITAKNDLSGLLNEINDYKNVANSSFTLLSEERAIGEVALDKCAACAALKQSHCFLVSSQSRTDGWLEWRLASDSNENLMGLVSLLKQNRCRTRLMKINDCNKKTSLTTRQKELVRLAFKLGYFEYPKKIGIRDLARLSGISISTASEILRSGQQKIIADYFRKFPWEPPNNR